MLCCLVTRCSVCFLLRVDDRRNRRALTVTGICKKEREGREFFVSTSVAGSGTIWPTDSFHTGRQINGSKIPTFEVV